MYNSEYKLVYLLQISLARFAAAKSPPPIPPSDACKINKLYLIQMKIKL